MKKSVKSILVLACIGAAVSVLMALTNFVTAPIIKENEQKKADAALLELLPDGGSFEKLDIESYTLPATVSEVYRAETGGYVVKLVTKGYKSGMVLMCGVAPDGTVAGSKMITSAETPHIGGKAAAEIAELLVGKDVGNVAGVDTISSATMTTKAYRNAVRDALNAVIILGGGSVDLRTPEEILADNLAAALPSAEGKFTKYFFVEAIEGVDAIYFADNKTGAVCVFGEQFVAVDADGESTNETAKNAVATANATEINDIDLSAYKDKGLPSHLVSAKRTATGNYIIEIKAAGYGIAGGDEYHPASGKYILIRVSITADGKIIDCLTLSQAESDGFGSACAEESFYGQFDGKTEDNYGEIDAISGATVTTDGYKKAISRAFGVVKIFEEGK